MADTLVQSNLEKISSFLQDVQYRSLMINSANYNVRLMRERKTRLPFLDSQTGIAQNPCKLYMSARHRMPGTAEGQLYVYPSQRWCCRKRSYMALAHQVFGYYL
ncbi:Zinc finger protein ubi-d4 A [Portunus trituberculatus]|uniref:Zinc finger protein ubi-d4 A n=1 Tax=Portunus trituberculatus TaxID=210409 RepID=A0A5B7D1W7_PORTR|nr:Zinc finger protein ubi-d4 A [Portunus trituberculatus]